MSFVEPRYLQTRKLDEHVLELKKKREFEKANKGYRWPENEKLPLFVQNTDTPGPASYNPKEYQNKYSGIISKASRSQLRTTIPGPGDYQLRKDIKQ